MAFNNEMTKSKSNPTDNINTPGYQLYSDSATLVTEFWNKVIMVKMHPAKPESERTNTSVYDYNKQLAVGLTVEKALTMGKYILEDIYPALLKGEECTRAVVTSKVNMLVVSTGVKLHGKVEPYIAICKNINESRKPSEMMICTLRKDMAITEYNHETGDFSAREDYPDLFTLGKFFEACDALLNAGVHADKFINRFLINKGYEFRAAVAGKLGIESSNKNYVNRTSNDNSESLWESSSPVDEGFKQSSAEVSTATFDSLSDLV